MITMGAVFIVYTLEFCPKCEILKDFLTSHQISSLLQTWLLQSH